MAIHIITDSGSDIPQGTEGVTVIPLQVSFGEETFEDGVTLDHHTFYEKLVATEELPRTSQITPYVYEQYYKPIVEAGNQIIVVTLSSKLSGTYQSACIAATEYPGQVYVVDSLNVSVGQRSLIDYGRSLIQDGLEIEEIVAKMDEIKHHIHLIALMDTLEYLKKGGRISSTAAFAGSVLKIKPVVALHEGEVVVLGKARGSKQGNNLLHTAITNLGGIDFDMPYYLGYTGNDRSLLDQYINDSESIYKGYCDDQNLPIMTVGGAIGTHIGPGTITLAFISKDR